MKEDIKQIKKGNKTNRKNKILPSGGGNSKIKLLIKNNSKNNSLSPSLQTKSPQNNEVKTLPNIKKRSGHKQTIIMNNENPLRKNMVHMLAMCEKSKSVNNIFKLEDKKSAEGKKSRLKNDFSVGSSQNKEKEGKARRASKFKLKLNKVPFLTINGEDNSNSPEGNNNENKQLLKVLNKNNNNCNVHVNNSINISSVNKILKTESNINNQSISIYNNIKNIKGNLNNNETNKVILNNSNYIHKHNSKEKEKEKEKDTEVNKEILRKKVLSKVQIQCKNLDKKFNPVLKKFECNSPLKDGLRNKNKGRTYQHKEQIVNGLLKKNRNECVENKIK